MEIAGFDNNGNSELLLAASDSDEDTASLEVPLVEDAPLDMGDVLDLASSDSSSESPLECPPGQHESDDGALEIAELRRYFLSGSIVSKTPLQLLPSAVSSKIETTHTLTLDA